MRAVTTGRLANPVRSGTSRNVAAGTPAIAFVAQGVRQRKADPSTGASGLKRP